jgi:hypothetical protein
VREELDLFEEVKFIIIVFQLKIPQQTISVATSAKNLRPRFHFSLHYANAAVVNLYPMEKVAFLPHGDVE